MDAAHTQTVAQAVAAATQQAQQAAQQQHAPSPPVQAPQQSSTIDNLTCQWQGCGERTDSAESLYDHVCERHVGRKSTNNLNLTCQWGACRTTTVKRDHITSHIRVHVPLKPHKCDFCGKAFKRPQDLKKHVKTHADDSVLVNSPGAQNGRSLANSQGAPTGYYPASHDAPIHNPYSSYQPSLAAGAHSGYAHAGTGGQYAGYGSVSYPNSSAIADIQSMDTRRRAIEALNDFLGDIKRRAIDPNSYYDVGHRLGGTSLPLPVSTGGYNTGYNNSGYSASSGGGGGGNNYGTAASLLDSFNSGSMGGGHGAQAGVASHHYSLPLPNARTKNDLQDIDRFLEQLQATVYETSNQAAAAGVQQPGLHTTFTGDFGIGHNHGQFRSSNSPSSFDTHLGSSSIAHSSAMSSNALASGLASPASGIDTPAMTPASVSSYNSSGHSPMSSHSRASFGSGSTGGNMYPSLPAVTGMPDLTSNYPTATSAPASGLASGFDFENRRYSGGRLQRQAPSEKEDAEMTDVDDGSRTPKASEAKPVKADIDPALRSEDEKPTEIPSSPNAAEDKRQEEWVENIRVIEALRKWVSDRLRDGDFDEKADAAETTGSDDADMKTVETAKMVEEKLAAVEQANKMHDEEVKYPSLPLSS